MNEPIEKVCEDVGTLFVGVRDDVCGDTRWSRKSETCDNMSRSVSYFMPALDCRLIKKTNRITNDIRSIIDAHAIQGSTDTDHQGRETFTMLAA
ncbi:unnamed protein product [Angiostrongylus costaricensis]|uniref:Uncharacterized protein n=1 Tax=Angiostrongylus costaricensis TaxID=334426 RepID=A0A0R3PJ87_ANGCS|nr:unnamed protein product [Angiostrongylus costaricensis]